MVTEETILEYVSNLTPRRTIKCNYIHIQSLNSLSQKEHEA